MEVTTTVKCPNCGADVPEENKFCGICGTKMQVENVCPNCGNKNPLSNKFCNNCGQKLG